MSIFTLNEEINKYFIIVELQIFLEYDNRWGSLTTTQTGFGDWEHREG